MKSMNTLVCMIVLLGIAAPAQAEIPRTINYQGILVDDTGTMVPNGFYTITFRLYDVPSGGTPLWEESQYLEVLHATFNAVLGSVTTLDLPFDTQYYLGISVSGEAEVSPRMALTAAAYSLNARGVSGPSNTFPPEGDVGIGTTSPGQKLAVAGGIEIAHTDTASAGAIRFTGSDFEGHDGGEWKSFTATGGGGLPGGTAGQTLYHDGSNWTADDFLYNSGTAIGIGTSLPTETVHVRGGADAGMRLESTASDGASSVLIAAGSDPTSCLSLQKSGLAVTGIVANVSKENLSSIETGPGAGALLLHVGSYNSIHLATHNSERMRINGDGELMLFGADHGTILEVTEDASYGGEWRLFDESGGPIVSAAPDTDGQGGTLNIYRNDFIPGFVVDGSSGGSNNTAVSIYGDARSAYFDMNQSGDGSVQLPGGAISDLEIRDEPGAASYAEGTFPVDIGPMHTIVGLRSIVTPTAGYVMAVASCGVELTHTSGTESNAVFGVSDAAVDLPANQERSVMLDATLPSGDRQFPVSCNGLFEVAAAGTHTFYLLGQEISGTFSCYDVQLTLVFIPTAYGDINPTAAGVHAFERTDGAPITDDDIARERAEAAALHAARMERELEDIRARLADLERELVER
jgi:hypothetical protein